MSQGLIDEKGTDTVKFMTQNQIHNIPKDKTVTYAHIFVDYRPNKTDPNRVLITAGGNLVDYHFESITHTADLVTNKII